MNGEPWRSTVVEQQRHIICCAQSILGSMPGHVRVSEKARGAEESE
jgi:hypothetical protein